MLQGIVSFSFGGKEFDRLLFLRHRCANEIMGVDPTPMIS